MAIILGPSRRRPTLPHPVAHLPTLRQATRPPRSIHGNISPPFPCPRPALLRPPKAPQHLPRLPRLTPATCALVSLHLPSGTGPHLRLPGFATGTTPALLSASLLGVLALQPNRQPPLFRLLPSQPPAPLASTLLNRPLPPVPPAKAKGKPACKCPPCPASGARAHDLFVCACALPGPNVYVHMNLPYVHVRLLYACMVTHTYICIGLLRPFSHPSDPHPIFVRRALPLLPPPASHALLARLRIQCRRD